MTERVLIVEDSDVIAEGIVHLLGDEFETVHAADGEIAREILGTDDSFGVVLCDVRMPRLGGLGLLQWARAERPDLVRRLLFMTANPDLPAAREIALTHEPLVKPFTRAALLETIRAIAANL
jgi:CheY-like chemotaxis protein